MSERAAKATSKEHLDERLDEGLEESFPASDPLAVSRNDTGPPPRATEEQGRAEKKAGA